MAQHGATFLRRHLLLRIVSGHWLLFACVTLGVAVALLTPDSLSPVSRALIGWNLGVWTYLAGSLRHLNETGDMIRRRAARQDEGGFAILILCTLAATASIAAIVMEIAGVKDMRGAERLIHVGLALATILGSWFFIHLMFALHYAHEFFTERDHEKALPPDKRGGIAFPGGEQPDFSDFLYFSYIIGVAAQTADVALTSKEMRRISLLHSIVAFFFNTAILALTINIASSLVSN